MEEEQKKEEEKKPITFRELYNPTDRDIMFKYDNANYIVPAGKRETFVTHIAEQGAKWLADRERMTNSPEEHDILKRAFLDEVSPEYIAEKLGINLEKIRSKASTEKKKEADLINVKDLVRRQGEELARLRGIVEGKEPLKVISVPTATVVEAPKVEEPEVEPVVKKKVGRPPKNPTE